MPAIARGAIVTVALVILVIPAAAQTILNPSFEQETDGLMPNGVSTDLNPDWGLPDHWTWESVGNCNGHGVRGPQAIVTDGEWSLYMFAMVQQNHVPGDYLEWYQDVDLTHVDAIFFDVYLGSHIHTEAYFAVDGEALWTRGTGGEYHGQFVDLAGYTGTHRIAVGVTVVYHHQGNADGHTWWDNLQVSGPVAQETRTWGGVRSLFR